MKLPDAPFLYPILDDSFSKDLIDDARQAIRAGAKILQIRAKRISKAKLFGLVQSFVSEEKPTSLIILNDYVDVVAVTDVHGVHLGQDDFPTKDARAILGDRIVGLSTHSESQFAAAQAAPVDYIAVGPIFDSATKPQAGASLGIEFVRSVRKRSRVPIVCIGGIESRNFAELLDAGADGIALISELYKGGNIYEAVSRLLEKL